MKYPKLLDEETNMFSAFVESKVQRVFERVWQIGGHDQRLDNRETGWVHEDSHHSFKVWIAALLLRPSHFCSNVPVSMYVIGGYSCCDRTLHFEYDDEICEVRRQKQAWEDEFAQCCRTFEYAGCLRLRYYRGRTNQNQYRTATIADALRNGRVSAAGDCWTQSKIFLKRIWAEQIVYFSAG